MPEPLSALVGRPEPSAWDEPAFPWADPAFSERMLAEHLSQDHDAASRRFRLVDAYAAWIDRTLLPRRSAVLELGCGPGLLLERLARLGHACTGIDVAPAALRYAAAVAERDGLACEYRLGDVRSLDLAGPFDVVAFVFGDLDTLPPQDAVDLLARCRRALRPGGRLLLEVHTPTAIEARAGWGRTWSALESGLFSNGPHLLLDESVWDEAAGAAVTRHTVVDPAAATFESFTNTIRLSDDGEYDAVLAAVGFTVERRYGDLSGRERRPGDDFVVIVARP
jgi:SAM-dependent methyltransferase